MSETQDWNYPTIIQLRDGLHVKYNFAQYPQGEPFEIIVPGKFGAGNHGVTRTYNAKTLDETVEKIVSIRTEQLASYISDEIFPDLICELKEALQTALKLDWYK